MKRLSLSSKDNKSSKPKRQRCESNFDEKDENEEEGNINDVVTSGQKTTFKLLLSKAGLKLRSKHPPLLSVDQAVFQRNLASELKDDDATCRKTKSDFVDGFGEFIEDIRKLWWFLNPTETHPDCDSARNSHQDAVVRLLLGISDIQSQLMTALLDKLLELSSNDESLFDDGDLKNVPKLILFQFRWLDTIVDSSALCEKLLEIASVVSPETHKEMIACIPEILEDKDHEMVAIAWSELLKQKTEFTPAILDSLPNLNISSDVLSEIKSTVLKSLEMIDVELFPLIVKFLLQSLKSADAIEVFSELRLTLDFSAGDVSTSSGTNSYKILTLDVIKTAVQFQKQIGDSLVKVLVDSKIDKKPNLVDLFLIFVLASIPSRKKAAENVLTLKIRNKTITEALIRKAFKNMKEICREYFPAMISLSDCIFATTDLTVREFGGFFHLVTFTEMDDASILQEVISSLVSHIRGGTELEVDMALNVLKQIVVAESKKVMPFSVFLKGLLDRLDFLSLSHFRKVYEILTILGQSSEGSGRGVLDDLHILVRKQLTNSKQRYRRMGIVGALTTLKKPTEDTLVSSTGYSKLASMKSLFSVIELNVTKDLEAKALFFEELSNAVSGDELQLQFRDWLHDHVTNSFQDDFILDETSENKLPKFSNMTGELTFALDDSSENEIALNLLTFACEDETFSEKSSVTKRLQLVCLPPQLRLICLCELASHDGDLEGLNAVLGIVPCRRIFPHLTNMLSQFNMNTRQQCRIICRCLFGTINWFIELINLFSSQKDQEIINKVVQRIQQTVKLRELLVKCLKGTPGFTPPLAHFDNENDDDECMALKPKTTATMTTKIAKDKPSTKNNKRKRNKTVLSTDELESTSTSSGRQMESTLKEESKKSSDKAIDLNSYALCFRELDLEVFLVFRRQIELKRSDDNDSEVMLRPPEISFLLKDLHSKLEVVLGKSVSKTPFFLKTKHAESECIHRRLKSHSKIKVVKFSIKILKYLKIHLETMADFLRENTDISDEDDDDDEDEKQMNNFVFTSDSFCYILDICSVLFCWEGFDDRDNKSLLCKSLRYFDEKDSTTSQPSIGHLTEKCFKYFRDFTSVTASFSCSTSLIKLLNVVAYINPKKQLNRQLVEVCEEVLKRDWNLSPETYKSTKFGSQLSSILKIYFNACDNVLESLETLTIKAIPELIANIGKTECSDTFPTLTKNTLPVFYELIHKHLISFLHSLDSDKEKKDAFKFQSWLIGVRIFHVLSQIIKAFDAPKIILLCLKNGRVFIDLFVKSAMPLVDYLFRTTKNDVSSLLKSLQQSTRFLQHVCGHSKIAKNVALTGSVPPLRKALEIFILRVKQTLAINKCKEAFWLGNLKNRNLQGDEILSQVPNEEEDNNEEEDVSSPVAEEDDKGSSDEDDVLIDNNSDDDCKSEHSSDSF